MDTTRQATARKVDAVREAAGMTIKDLSVASGIPYATLYRELKGQSSFDFDDIDALAVAMGVPQRDLVEFAEAVSV